MDCAARVCLGMWGGFQQWGGWKHFRRNKAKELPCKSFLSDSVNAEDSFIRNYQFPHSANSLFSSFPLGFSLYFQGSSGAYPLFPTGNLTAWEIIAVLVILPLNGNIYRPNYNMHEAWFLSLTLATSWTLNSRITTSVIFVKIFNKIYLKIFLIN